MSKRPSKNKFSIENIGIFSKNALAFLFMSIVPLLLVLNLVFLIPNIASGEDGLLTYARVTIALMVISALFGYIFLRRTVKALAVLIKKAEHLASGEKGKKIEVADNDELSGLAVSLNTINANLEAKIRELECSQRLTHELFEQIGGAITGNQKVKALFDIIVHGMNKAMNASSSFIALYDRAGDLRMQAHTGNAEDINDDMVLADDKGIIGMAIRNKRPVLKNGSDLKTRDHAGRYTLGYKENIGCAPVIVHNNIRGILGVVDKAGPQMLGPEDTSLLENIASQAALCVDNIELSKNIEEMYYDTLVMLARIVEAKDPYSAGHLERVSTYVKMMADRLNIDEDGKKILFGGALLHDLGKVGVDDAILKKGGKLTPAEWDIMKHHTAIGENILRPLHSMSKLSVLVRHHHECYDGSGYPDGLKGEGIPLLARILTVADIYDAITTDRSYRRMMSREDAIKELRNCAGTKLDPKLVEIFIELVTSGK